MPAGALEKQIFRDASDRRQHVENRPSDYEHCAGMILAFADGGLDHGSAATGSAKGHATGPAILGPTFFKLSVTFFLAASAG